MILTRRLYCQRISMLTRPLYLRCRVSIESLVHITLRPTIYTVCHIFTLITHDAFYDKDSHHTWTRNITHGPKLPVPESLWESISCNTRQTNPTDTKSSLYRPIMLDVITKPVSPLKYKHVIHPNISTWDTLGIVYHVNQRAPSCRPAGGWHSTKCPAGF